MKARVRMPAVAGRFYPGDAAALARDVATRSNIDRAAQPMLGLIGPHAGFIYSGDIAGHSWARVVVPPQVVLLCPNHTGEGAAISVWSGGPWQIPTATVAIAEALRDRIVAESPDAELDARAHVAEHAIEVHLPFLIHQRHDAQIVPICLGRLSAPRAIEFGQAIARAIEAIAPDTLVVASTDMSHYICAARAAELDGLAIGRMIALDAAGLHTVVEREHISMCGYVPATAALACTRARGAVRAELVEYGNSGTTSGDFERVVGYAGLVVAPP